MCTVLIAEAIVTVIHGRENGDLMVIVCPILGATFLSIPAVRAWWMCSFRDSRRIEGVVYFPIKRATSWQSLSPRPLRLTMMILSFGNDGASRSRWAKA